MSSHSGERKFADEHVQIAQTNSSKSNGVKPTFGQRAKSHFKKWWWLHIIVFCAVFLLVVLLLVYVGLPKWEQEGVDESSLTLLGMSYLEPTANSFTFSQQAILHNPKKFTPTLDAFNASVYVVSNGVLGSTSLTTLPLPEIHAVNGQAVNITDKHILINDEQQVTNFCIEVITQKTVTNRIVGKTNVHLGAMPVNSIDYNQEITYPGMNGLEGFNVTSLHINLTAAAGEPNMRGIAVIPNPSILTVAMGNVTLNLATAEQGLVGNSTVFDMTLRPGTNEFVMTGFVDQPKVQASLNGSGFANLILWGQSAVYKGVHLPYYEAALAAHNMSLPLNILQVVRDSLSL